MFGPVLVCSGLLGQYRSGLLAIASSFVQDFFCVLVLSSTFFLKGGGGVLRSGIRGLQSNIVA